MEKTKKIFRSTSEIFKNESRSTLRPMKISKSNIRHLSDKGFDIFSCIAKVLPLYLYDIEENSIKSSLLLAEKAYFFRRYEECISMYKEILATDNKCIIAIINLSASLFMKRHYMESFKILSEISLRNKEYFVGTYNKILSLIMLKHYKPALELIKSLLSKTENDEKENIIEIKKYCENQIRSSINLVENTRKLRKNNTLVNFEFPFIQHSDTFFTERKVYERKPTKSLDKQISLNRTKSPLKNTVKLIESTQQPIHAVSSSYSNFIRISRIKKKNSMLEYKRKLKDKKITQLEQYKKNFYNELNNFPNEKDPEINDKVFNLPDENEITEKIITSSLTTQAILDITNEYSKPVSSRNYILLA